MDSLADCRYIVDSTWFVPPPLGKKFGERNFFWAWYKMKVKQTDEFQFVPSTEKVSLAKFYPRRNQMESTIFCFSRQIQSKLRDPARFPLLGLLLSLGCWVRAWQKPSKDPAVKTQNVVEKVSARDPARDPTTNLARKAQGVADQRCGPGQPHKVCNNRRWSRPFSPTSRQQSPGRL